MGIESPVHLIFIGIVALLVLGPKRLPEMARALGHGLREFREAMNLEGEHPIEHAPVVSHPVADPAMPEPPVADAQQQAAAVGVAAAPAAPATGGQGDPLADSFARVEDAPSEDDPARTLPSPPDASDSRAL